MVMLRLKKSRLRVEKIDIERERLASLINSMTDAVIAVDKNCKIVIYNAAALNILDSNTIPIGGSLGKLFKPININNQPVDILKKVLATTVATTSRDLRLKYDDSSIINLFLSIAPVHIGYGRRGSQGFVLALRDITREKSLEEERDEFISVVSHELRTPIAISEGDISNAQLIVNRTGNTTAVKKALEEAHSQVLFLADMINDLATLSRAEQNKLDLSAEWIDVPALLHELIDNYTPSATAKKLKLNLDIDERVTKLASSKLYVREILQNFLVNAIKYTQTGSVTLRAGAIDTGVVFSVIDTGIGISKADQERVFDKFFRSEDYRTRKSKGTGLGLYVTMKLTRLIHADIKLWSVLNKGSTFTITVPNLMTKSEA
jgi:two-component system phosphate regulon sensor histidine kinase PhoR